MFIFTHFEQQAENCWLFCKLLLHTAEFSSRSPILECVSHLIEGSAIYKLLWYLISLAMVPIDHSSLSWGLLWRKTILPCNFKSLQFVFMVKAESGTICVKLLAPASNFLNHWQKSWRLGMYIALFKNRWQCTQGDQEHPGPANYFSEMCHCRWYKISALSFHYGDVKYALCGRHFSAKWTLFSRVGIKTRTQSWF